MQSFLRTTRNHIITIATAKFTIAIIIIAIIVIIIIFIIIIMGLPGARVWSFGSQLLGVHGGPTSELIVAIVTITKTN